jgi:hypothetical protein
MNCFDYEAAQLADQSSFDVTTWVVTTRFANSDDFLERVEAELGFDDRDSIDGTSAGQEGRHESVVDIFVDAKASHASPLNDPDMDLAANSHSAKSRRTNFSCSTGNSMNQLVNTKQYALTHKTRALDLATNE